MLTVITLRDNALRVLNLSVEEWQRDPSPELQIRVASAQLKYADILGNPFNLNCSDSTGACENYRAALNTLESFPAALETSSTISELHFDALRLRALAHMGLGDLAGNAYKDPSCNGCWEQAEASYRSALGILDSLCRSEQTGISELQKQKLRQNHMTVLNRLADVVLRKSDGKEEARRHYQQAESIAQAIVKEQPGSIDALRDLWVSRVKIASVADGEACLKQYEQALDLAHELAVQARSDLWATYIRYALALRESTPDKARQLLELALKIVDEQLDFYPEGVRAQLDNEREYTRRYLQGLNDC